MRKRTRAHTHTHACTRARREAPPLPRFSRSLPGPRTSLLPACCTLPASIHAASGALSVVFPRRSCHWLITSAWPIKAF